mgnify:CR=1 FL=1
MELAIYERREETGQAAASEAASALNRTIERRGAANLVLATGTSQFEMLDSLVDQNVPWERVTAFHLDEYVGLRDTHPASFVRYLRERFEQKLPRSLNQLQRPTAIRSGPTPR